ncbi:hypothetical protein FALBO_14762 [Fusarium albosuccineum]|uniref:Uncharacterized protein n=1 Tax=Fusarium albosuccineum TaxID=1237068 RepID=A0A8H4KW01_9HYPO|nr:hypothetical protein FALBO_14762 [Fusarium albosuccineum]
MQTCQVLESTPDEASEQPPPVPPRKEPVERDTVEAQAEKAPLQTGPSAIDPAAQLRITELEQQLQAITQEWRKTARDLNELQARGEKSNQMNDGTLIERAVQLRYAIWTFSIQYFDSDTTTRKSTWWKKDAPYFYDLEDTTPSPSALESRLRHPTQRAKVVAAFLWRVLCNRVFDAFDWAGEDIGSSIHRLRRFLNASKSDQPGPSSTPEHLPWKIENRPRSLGEVVPRPEAEREFQMWSTATVELVLDVLDTHGSKAADAQEHLAERKDDISKSVKQLFKLDDESEGITDALKSILDDAFALDKIMSQQVARLEWVFDVKTLEKRGCRFDAETMEMDEGATDGVVDAGRKVCLVVAPALVKRGKSTGEDFDKERILLKRSVWCE